MAAEDWLPDFAFEDEEIDEEGCSNGGGYWYSRPTLYKVCKYCGEKGLIWKQLPTGWRLHSPEGVLHDCSGRYG